MPCQPMHCAEVLQPMLKAVYHSGLLTCMQPVHGPILSWDLEHHSRECYHYTTANCTFGEAICEDVSDSVKTEE